MTVWIIAVIIVIALLAFIGIYNRLVSSRNAVANALADIDTELTRRYDLIPNLVETAKKYMEHESSTLTAVTAARSGAVNALDAVKTAPNQQNLTALAQKDNSLNRAIAGLSATFEAYPELKADSQMIALQEELANTENRISMQRKNYNSAVTAYNNTAQQFPNNILAGFFKFKPSQWLEIENIAEKRDAVKINFS